MEHQSSLKKESSGPPTDLSELGEAFVGYAPKAQKGQSEAEFEKEELMKHAHPAPPITLAQFKGTKYYAETFNKEDLGGGYSAPPGELEVKANDNPTDLNTKPEPVTVREVLAPKLSDLSLPFRMGIELKPALTLTHSESYRHHRLSFVNELRVNLKSFTSTFSDMMDSVFAHYHRFNVLQVGDIPVVPNPRIPGERMVDMDPMGIIPLLESEKIKTADYNTWYPAAIQRPVVPVMNDDPFDNGDGNLEVAVQAIVPLDPYARALYSGMHVLNKRYLSKESRLREYMRYFDDDMEYTLPRPMEEDITKTFYYLPDIVPNQYTLAIEANPNLLAKMFDVKLAETQKYLQLAGRDAATTFRELANVLNIRSTEYSSVNEAVRTISKGRGASAMHRLVTVMLYNSWYEISMDLPWTRFDITTIMECFAMKMLCPAACLSYDTRVMVDNYLCSFFFGSLKIKTADNSLRWGNAHVPLHRRSDATRLPQVVHEFLQLYFDTLQIDANDQEIYRAAFKIFFLTWSRGLQLDREETIRPAQDPFPMIDSDNADTVEELPANLESMHSHPAFWTNVTSKLDHNVEDPWDKVAALGVIVTLLSSDQVQFNFTDPRQGGRIKELIKHLMTTYYNMQAYAIDFNREVRKMASNPTTQVMSDATSAQRAEDRTHALRKQVIMNPGDFSSALLALSFAETKVVMPVQDIYINGLNELTSFDEFVTNFSVLRGYRDQFVADYPAYADLVQRTDLIEMAWKHVNTKHPNAEVAFKAYKEYGTRVFQTLDEIDVPPGEVYFAKLTEVILRWSEALDSGMLGIVNEMIIKPTTPLDQERFNFPIYRYIDIFTQPDGRRTVTFNEFIAAVNRGILARPDANAALVLNDLFEPDTKVTGFWITVNEAGERDTNPLAVVLDKSMRLDVMSVSVKSVWGDLKRHIELGLYDPKPVVGVTNAPFITILANEWNQNPWYRSANAFMGIWEIPNATIELRHPINFVTKVQRVSRS
jgi:hypothetical protein